MTKKLAVALAAVAMSTAALAAPPDSITTAVTLTPDSTDPTTAYGDIDVRKANPNQSFNDYYTFHLDALSDVSFSVVSDPLYNAAGNVLLKAASFDGLKLEGPNDFQSNGTISLDALHASFGISGLAAGDYKITLLGHSIGKAGGSYYGDLSVTNAVPEPESLALMLAGAGVIGLVGRRRNKA